jgi:hypothetical protein
MGVDEYLRCNGVGGGQEMETQGQADKMGYLLRGSAEEPGQEAVVARGGVQRGRSTRRMAREKLVEPEDQAF